MKTFAKILLVALITGMLMTPFLETLSVFTDKMRLESAVQATIRAAVMTTARDEYSQDGVVNIDYNKFVNKFKADVIPVLRTGVYSNEPFTVTTSPVYDGTGKITACNIVVQFNYRFKSSLAKRLQGVTDSSLPLKIRKRQSLVIYY